MKNVIYVVPFEENSVFTTFSFYNSLLPELQKHYKNFTEAPIFSFEKLNRIDPLVLPNILGLGYYLSKFHNAPIELLLSYNPKLLYYLHKAEFFNICSAANILNPIGLNIFKFDNRFIGGFSSYIDKEQRKEHQLHYYLPIETNNKGDDLHDSLLEDLSLFILKDHYSKIFLDTITEEGLSKSIECIAEPISNGILHSRSITWAISQTVPKPFERTILSIVDVGIGFKESLKEKGVNFSIIPKVINEGIYEDQFEDLYYIFEALYFSITNDRLGLTDFIFNILENGTVRIHYNSTQILFTPRILNYVPGLKECRKRINKEYDNNNELSESTRKNAVDEIFNLLKVFLRLYCQDKKYSPLRIYDVIFKGVHIEFELPKIYE